MGILRGVSIIVPVLNEADNIRPLVKRLNAAVAPLGIDYEIIFIDDHSTDRTAARIKTLASKQASIAHHLKAGKRGKAFSIIEGVAKAQYANIIMIDADLQYAPENIPSMIDTMNRYDVDVVITERKAHQTSFLRKLSSFTYTLLFTKLLFGLDVDSQSGLKLFKKNVFENLTLSPSAWSFDLEFIINAFLAGYTVKSMPIIFGERLTGEAKVHVLQATFELAYQSIKLRLAISGTKLRTAYKQNKRYVASRTKVAAV